MRVGGSGGVDLAGVEGAAVSGSQLGRFRYQSPVVGLL